MALVLHGYWRSSAAYRVRIALALKGLAFQQVSHDLRTGAQGQPAYRARNPQGLVPMLEHGDLCLTQSGTIIEYLDEVFPDPPLLPADPVGRARVRAMADLIACDVHPLNNLRVLKALRSDFGADEEAVAKWARRWIGEGFAALESLLDTSDGRFCHGGAPTMADCHLVPQVYYAERFALDLAPYPRIRAIAEHCRALPAFAAAHPSRQPDAD